MNRCTTPLRAQAHSFLCEECPTRRVCLAAGLERNDLSGLEGILTPSSPIAAQTHVYRAGDPAKQYFYVRSGMFKTYTVSAAGDEQVTGFYFPGEMIGCAQVQSRHADFGMALETATVCALPVSNVADLCAMGLDVAFLERLGEREAEATRHRSNLNQSRADNRFAGWLLLVTQRLSRLRLCPTRIPTPMSRTDLASYLGMTLESLSRVSARFEKSGLINAHRDHIDLLDPDRIAVMGAHAIH